MAIATVALIPGLAGGQPTTTRLSEAPGGADASGPSRAPAITPDGRWVAFSSAADNLVPGDTNGREDVFVHDRLAGTTTRVSVGSGGAQGNHDSSDPAISADGRWVAFYSFASNLVGGDTNGYGDVFVHDLHMGTTTRVSVRTGGLQGNGASYTPAITPDGRWVAFLSYATNLVAGDTNGYDDAFLHDRQTGATTRVSVGTGGYQSNGDTYAASVSADGRWVAFESYARNLVVGDTNGTEDIFVHDRLTATTTRVSVGFAGQANSYSFGPSISADGRWVAFESWASNLVPGDANGAPDVFVHDRQSGSTALVSTGALGAPGDGPSTAPVISADARWVAFQSDASTLVTGDTNGVRDGFIHDRQTQTTTRVSVASTGTQGREASDHVSISADGQFVAFASAAPDLIPVDVNAASDVFVVDRGDTSCVSEIDPGSALAPAGGASGTIDVNAPPGCAWSVASSDPGWLSVTAGGSGTGNGSFDYAATANAGAPRAGRFWVGWHEFTLDQASAATPLAPVALVAHSIVGNLVTLRWSVPTAGIEPTAFAVEGGLHPGEVLASLPTNSTAPTFTFPAPTGSFYVRVHALAGGLRSPASNELQIHVNALVPPAGPTGLLGLVNGSTVALAWSNSFHGGAPTSLQLDVTGAFVGSFPLALADSASFAGVPPGTYTLTLRARGLRGFSAPSNPVTLTVPAPCSGPPLVPTNLLAYRMGSTVFVDWAPAASGPAPTSYVLHVIGAFTGDFPTAGRALSGTVGPGAYTLSVEAVNACGASGSTAAQTVVVP